MQVCRHGVTSSDALSFRTWIGRSAKTPRSDHRLKKKKGFSRSARTRRSFRRRRQGLSGAGVRDVQYGVDVNLHSVQCTVDSVKHTASPSHRDCSRRVIVSLVFQLRSATSNTGMFGPLRATYLGQFSSTCVQASRSPVAAAGRCFFPLFEARETIAR